MLRQPTLCIIAATITLLATTANTALGTPRLTADTIKAGLRTTFIEEDGFVNEVVDMANQGELPWAMVDNSFSWAKRKPKNQFQYFRKSLIDLAARKGIVVPRPPKQAKADQKSPFFIQKIKDFFTSLKGSTSGISWFGIGILP